MPRHIVFLLRHAGIGVLLSLAFAGLILWFDIGHIRHLVTHTDEGPLAFAVFVVFCTITFGSVQMGIRIMMMGDRDDDDHGRRDRAPVSDPVPVRVRCRDVE